MIKTNYIKIAQITGLKVNHVKQVLKGKRKAKFRDLIEIKFAILDLKIMDL